MDTTDAQQILFVEPGEGQPVRDSWTVAFGRSCYFYCWCFLCSFVILNNFVLLKDSQWSLGIVLFSLFSSSFFEFCQHHIIPLSHTTYTTPFITGNSFSDEKRCIVARYVNDDVKLFDLRTNSIVCCETNVASGEHLVENCLLLMCAVDVVFIDAIMRCCMYFYVSCVFTCGYCVMRPMLVNKLRWISPFEKMSCLYCQCFRCFDCALCCGMSLCFSQLCSHMTFNQHRSLSGLVSRNATNSCDWLSVGFQGTRSFPHGLRLNYFHT